MAGAIDIDIPKELPPLEEIIGRSFQDIKQYLPYINLSELLLLAAFQKEGKRTDAQIRQIAEQVEKRFQDLVEQRVQIRRDIFTNLYPDLRFNDFETIGVKNYLEKYRLLTTPAIASPELIEGLQNRLMPKDSKRIVSEIGEYRESISHFGKTRGRKATPKTVDELTNLQNTPVILQFHYSSGYTNEEPYMLLKKIKAPRRIAGKIPNNIIREFRKYAPGQRGSPPDSDNGDNLFRNNISGFLYNQGGITEGEISDYVGLQFVVHSREEVERIKQYILQSDDIEVTEFENIYENSKSDYKAHHIKAVWSPPTASKSSGKERYQHNRDSVEIIIIEDFRFFSAHFGVEAYYRRAIAQEMGIVGRAVRNGSLRIDGFSQSESRWRNDAVTNIMRVFEYVALPPNK